MKIEDLTWAAVTCPAGTGTLISASVIRAVVWCARQGYGDTSCARFLNSLVQTNTLTDKSQWPAVLRQMRQLQTEAELTALESGDVVRGELR